MKPRILATSTLENWARLHILRAQSAYAPAGLWQVAA